MEHGAWAPISARTLQCAVRRRVSGVLWGGQSIIAIATSLTIAGPAAAHVDEPYTRVAPWGDWPFALEILIGTALVVIFYAVGMWRRTDRNRPGILRKHLSFFAGVTAILAAVQSPLDSLAQHSFAAHQVQHLLLYALGPMLLMLAAPQTLLIAGMPGLLQRGLVFRLMRSHAVRAVFAFIALPAVATLIFVGSMWFWQLPHLHDLTLLDRPLHYFMHISMLLAGLVFFWRVLDSRPPPLGAGYGTRVVMITAAIAGTMPLGAYLALKEQVLYPSYDWFGRIWELNGSIDETHGGLIIWIPGGFVLAAAILVVLRMWGGREQKADAWRKRGIAGVASGDAATLRVKNRNLALQLFGFALIAFAGLIAIISIGLAVLA